MAESRGKLITLEGGEGAGKSTQVRLLADALRATGLEVVETREPGGSPGAEEIRQLLVSGETGRWDPMTEALLHFAARREHMEKRVRPALAAGLWVISDRFADSTMAYQGYGLGLDKKLVAELYLLVVGSLAPDLTLILDLPVEVGLGRAKGRDTASAPGTGDRYERMAVEMHERLRAGFLEIAQMEPKRCAVIDASQDQAGVAAAIKACVQGRLGLALA